MRRPRRSAAMRRPQRIAAMQRPRRIAGVRRVRAGSGSFPAPGARALVRAEGDVLMHGRGAGGREHPPVSQAARQLKA